MVRIAILDDYQGVALSMADFAPLEGRCAFDILREHVADRAELAERLAGAEVVVGMRERTVFDEDMLSRLPDLKLLITTGMVNRSFDMDAAKARGIVVSGTPGGGTQAAELAFGLVLSLARQIPEAATAIRDSGRPWQSTMGVTLAGRTLGLVGFGRLGREMARYGQAFGMEVLAHSRSLTDAAAADAGIRRAGTLGEVMREADFVSIHLTETEETRGMIGRDELASMKPSAFLVNTARGPIVDEAALAEALEAGAIRGAALDVFGTEPLPADHPFRRLPNVIATPHLGYVTEESYRAYFGGVVEAIEGWLDGAPVRVLNP